MELDTDGMMRLVAAIVVQSAYDIAKSIPPGRDYPAAQFLTDAGIIHRLADIAIHTRPPERPHWRQKAPYPRVDTPRPAIGL